MNFKKLAVSAITAGAALALAAMPVMASASSNVSNVKDDSFAVAVANDGSNLQVMNMSMGSVDNLDVAIVNTGLNFVKGDDHNSLASGNANAGSMAFNKVNDSNVAVAGWDEGNANASVDGVKDDSKGFATANDKNLLVITQMNYGTVHNADIAIANTGLNAVGGEDKNKLTTGAAMAISGASNNVNNTDITVAAKPEPESATASVSSVKDDSHAVAVANDSDTVKVSTVNMGSVDNLSAAVANTGANVVGGDDKNSVSTGNAAVVSASSNTVNTSVVSISL
jgi:hypothetical protein